jgi:hypothetical protein
MRPYEFLKGGVAFIFSTCIQVEKLTPHFPSSFAIFAT